MEVIVETGSEGVGLHAAMMSSGTTFSTPQAKTTDPLKVRFSDATWFDWLQGREVLLIGAGGIGSWVALCLSRIGVSLTVVDNDVVEAHNLGGQMYRATQVNERKVEALRDACKQYAGAAAEFYSDTELYTSDSYTNPIVIMAVDNMKTRREAFERWMQAYAAYSGSNVDKEALFIDGRLLAEDYQVYAVTPDIADLYRETLFLDAEVPKEMCTLKSTTHCSLGIASDIVSILTNFAANRVTMSDPELGVETRDVPFKIVKSIPFYSYEVTFKADGNNTDKSTNSDSRCGDKGSYIDGGEANTTEHNLSRASLGTSRVTQEERVNY